MSQAKKDDKVKVHYTGTLNDGTVGENLNQNPANRAVQTM